MDYPGFEGYRNFSPSQLDQEFRISLKQFPEGLRVPDQLRVEGLDLRVDQNITEIKKWTEKGFDQARAGQIVLLELSLRQGLEERRTSIFRRLLFNKLGCLISFSQLTRGGKIILASDCRESFLYGVPLLRIERSADGLVFSSKLEFPPMLQWALETNYPGGVFDFEGAKIGEALKYQWCSKSAEKGPTNWRRQYIDKFKMFPEEVIG